MSYYKQIHITLLKRKHNKTFYLRHNLSKILEYFGSSSGIYLAPSKRHYCRVHMKAQHFLFGTQTSRNEAQTKHQ